VVAAREVVAGDRARRGHPRARRGLCRVGQPYPPARDRRTGGRRVHHGGRRGARDRGGDVARRSPAAPSDRMAAAGHRGGQPHRPVPHPGLPDAPRDASPGLGGGSASGMLADVPGFRHAAAVAVSRRDSAGGPVAPGRRERRGRLAAGRPGHLEPRRAGRRRARCPHPGQRRPGQPVARSAAFPAATKRRLGDSSTSPGWRRHLERNTGAELLANFVDLGRPPIVGLVEPGWELRRVAAELAELDHPAEVP
jgi:hypothetical protein